MFVAVKYDKQGSWLRNWIAHENQQTLWETILEYCRQKGICNFQSDQSNFSIVFENGDAVIVEKLLTLREVVAAVQDYENPKSCLPVTKFSDGLERGNQ